jgi:hypothetical protein
MHTTSQTSTYTSLVILVDPSDAQQLRDRAIAYGTTQSAILRQLIERRLRITTTKPKPRDPRRVAVLLPKPVAATLRKHSEQADISVSENLRAIVRDWLRAGAPWPPE